ncbi:hypothetical protein SAMN05192566_0746 [Methylophilus rhizosphaerae]|uniref:Uncharacterized protein n=1 Tax=Methylophilus rhizosphaerae TaxID=492660 RepID=A0A1G9AAZ1_9PROT|nr:hypothetical protein [Methylophilus rhizosphaerae]SDK23620.1 hypothetical protein SAMN05192566_0746 [Methylophilus rhizosphaerae]
MIDTIYNYDEIGVIVNEALAKANLEVNVFGFVSIVEECLYYQEQGREVHAQLDYIIEQAIPDGCRDEYFDK